MSYRKFFKPVNSVLPQSNRSTTSSSYASISKYNSWLPEVYAGPPDRLQRYAVYDQMSLDHEISAALDTFADFGTELDDSTKLPFIIKYNDEPTTAEIQVLSKSLSQWCRLNKFNKRVWRMFRSTLAYGDQFFIRDPETFKLYWVDPAKVEKVIVNESEGKKIESYFIKDIDLNVQNLVMSNQLNRSSNTAFGSNSIIFTPPMQGNMTYVSGGFGSTSASNYQTSNAIAIDAEHVVQLSLTEGLSASWPFGVSILENIYKVYKQKELLEDAILIYRIHRAPERRIFTIDVGTMPPNKAQQYIERIKYEVQQKRIPGRTGTSANIMDSTYNPMCLALDTSIALTDGTFKTLAEIIKEVDKGNTLYTYSKDNTFNTIPAKIKWAGITRRNTEVYRVTLSNGTFVDATFDHIFVLSNGQEVQVQTLKVNDFLLTEKKHIWVTDIKKLEKTVDTGDITVESKSHLFLLDTGIYVHNSMLEDYYFAKSVDGRGSGVTTLSGGNNLGCFSLDTKVSLADGRDLTILEVKKELEKGEELYTFSCHPITGEIDRGLISWAGPTRHNAKVIKLLLSNNKTIICTPDHNFPVLDRGFIRADKLDIGEKLNTLGTKIFLIGREELEETMTVGTLTIDRDEKYHDWHTYLLSVGVFVKNSIDDLKYFNNKMIRALGIPSSYIPSAADAEGTSQAPTGKVGATYVQEHRFAKVVSRFQSQIIEPLDTEFKLFLLKRGVNIDNSLFKLEFTPPESFSEYRKLELDSARVNMFSTLKDLPYMSKRYLLKHFLRWSEAEMAENERMWKEERSRLTKVFPASSSGGGSMSGSSGLSSMGITGSDISSLPETPPGNEEPSGGGMSGGETGANMGNEAPGGEEMPSPTA